MELANTTEVLIHEIENKQFTRDDVAKTYALALRSSFETDWKAINEKIIKRWSPSTLEYIKNKAWSGKCFEEKSNHV